MAAVSPGGREVDRAASGGHTGQFDGLSPPGNGTAGGVCRLTEARGTRGGARTEQSPVKTE